VEREKAREKEAGREQARKKEVGREQAREKEAEREMEREQAGEKAEDWRKGKKVKMKSEKRGSSGEAGGGGLVGVSLLRHGKGDRIHHRRQQILPDGGGVPCSGDELVEQGNLFIRGGVGLSGTPRDQLQWVRPRVDRWSNHLPSGGAAPRAGKPSSHHQS
jgi:hypothetical protein